MFSGALPLVVAGSAPKILKTNQFYFLFILDCAACNIPVVKIRQFMLRAAEPKDETPGGVPLSSMNHKSLKMTAFSRFLLYRHSSHNREFHNVNCRFCGAVHSVNWACISVLSQVIRNVNERKTVQTNMISFVSHGAGILKIS